VNDRNDGPAAGETMWATAATADGPMRIYTAWPAAAAADRAVVVLQEAFGVNDHIQEVARRLAARGYLAIAPDLFHRTGVSTLSYSQHAEAMPLIGAIGPDAIITDVAAALQFVAAAHGIPAGRTALVGFCFGGRAAFTAATALPGLAGTVAFYGPGIAAGPHAVIDRAAGLTAPVLLHVGAEDPTIPAEQVTAIEAALTASGAEHHSYVYPAAGHAFACDARPDMYRPGPAADAWQRTWDFLGTHLPGPASAA
jgi:carboxymethylenebutenolidase